MGYNGKARLMKGYTKEVVGDSIGAYMQYDFDKPTQIEMKVGVSYVSIENARENLEKETSGKTFDEILRLPKKSGMGIYLKLKWKVALKMGKPSFIRHYIIPLSILAL